MRYVLCLSSFDASNLGKDFFKANGILRIYIYVQVGTRKMEMKGTFESLLAEGMEELKGLQDQFIKAYDINRYKDWHYDQASGIFRFSNDEDLLYFSYQSIGTLSMKAGTWLWSWANSHTHENVKNGSRKIRDFGVLKGFEKLTTECWEATEFDGWEMLAFANKLLNPIGVYRIPVDDLFIFVIFTQILSKDEAEQIENESDTLVDCAVHGKKRVAFGCQHLNKVEIRGFNEAFETWENMELEDDDDFQAWCDECEEIRVKYDGWNSESEKFVELKLFCEDCYFEIKHMNF